MDVNTTFLCGDFDEEIYMGQPKGFIPSAQENKCVSSLDLYIDSSKLLNNSI